VLVGADVVEHVEDGGADAARVGHRVGTALAHESADAVDDGRSRRRGVGGRGGDG